MKAPKIDSGEKIILNKSYISDKMIEFLKKLIKMTRIVESILILCCFEWLNASLGLTMFSAFSSLLMGTSLLLYKNSPLFKDNIVRVFRIP